MNVVNRFSEQLYSNKYLLLSLVVEEVKTIRPIRPIGALHLYHGQIAVY